MPADVRIRFRAEGNAAQQEMQRLRNEVNRLQRELGQTQGVSRRASQGLQATGQAAIQTEQSVDRLNDELTRGTGLWRDQNGRLRNAQGRFIAAGRGANELTRSIGGANQGTATFTSSLGNLNNILGGLAIAAVTAQIAQFATASVRAAAELEGYERGLKIIEGTQAPERLQQLISVANLPGLQLSQLINFSNRLRSIGLSAEETDKILLTTGQTIISMGGTADLAAEAVEQITQALQTNTVSMQDFRSIAQRIPGFYNAIADTHGVEASIDGFRDAVENAGGSVRDALIPVMDTLADRFGSPPTDSYVVAMDALENSFFLLQAEIGENFLPVIARAANSLAVFFDAIRENNLDDLPEPIQAVIEGAQSLYDGFVNVGESIRRGLGPELDLLLPTIGNLLGQILDLAGSLANALAPAYEIVAVPTRIAISLIVHLAETIADVIGAITSFVDWVTGAAEAQKELQTSTQVTAEAVGAASAALGEGATATERFQASIKDLESELDSVNQQLETKRQRYQELKDQGVNPATASMQQLQRQITALEGDQSRLTGEIGKTEAQLEEATTATDGATDATHNLAGATKEAAVELKNYAEILATLQKNVQEASRTQQTLAEVQEELNTFFRLARGEIQAYNASIDVVIPSVVNLTETENALTAAIEANLSVIDTYTGDAQELIDTYESLSDGLTSFAS